VAAGWTSGGPAVVTVGSGVIVVGSFLPWVRSGEVSRSSYSVVHAAELLDVVHGAPAQALKVWYLVPIMAAMGLLATVGGARRVVLAVGAGLGVTTALVTGAVLAAPVRLRIGPWVTLAGLAVLVAGLIVTSFDLRGAR
jgi:hypothetical protein